MCCQQSQPNSFSEEPLYFKNTKSFLTVRLALGQVWGAKAGKGNCALLFKGQGVVFRRNKSRTHLSVEVVATLELAAVFAQLIMTDGTGILTGGLASKGMLSYLTTISN